jgi:indole-3-glycerol phosphate synthase
VTAPTSLERILRSTRAELTRRKRELPPRALAELALGAERAAGPPRLRRALQRPSISVIAEFKRCSPSAGVLREGADVAEIARAYERGGASALSVLTEGPHFQGSLEDLRLAREACRLPALRKDFIIDEYQLYEALAAKADAVLLIVSALTEAELAALHERARALGLEALVEVHDGEELKVALGVEAELIGINNRDLRDLTIDVERTSRLMAEVPDGVTVVSESGIASAGQLRRLEGEGVAAVLVGEALMRAEDPGAAVAALLGADSRTHLTVENI